MKRMFFILLGLFLFLIQSGFAQVPQTTSLQGVLVDQTGSLFSDGNYEITFRIYDVATGGNAFWTEQQTVGTESGIFNVVLGSVNPLNHTFDRPYWIGITIGSGQELIPRLALSASPYSLMAKTVSDSSITGAKIAEHTAVRSLNGKTDAISLAAGANISISEVADSLVISAVGVGMGDITGVLPGDGMTGGGTTGDLTLSLADSGVTADKIASAQVVKSINTLQDDIMLKAEGGATISTSGDTITINAGAGGQGLGVQGIQNMDNSLEIVEPTGPTTTINIKAGGITSAQLADSSITRDKIVPGVTLPPDGPAGGDLLGEYPNPKVAALQGRAIADSTPGSGEVLKWDGSQWAPAADNAGSSAWQTNGQDIFYSDGAVSIGTDAPSARMQVFHNSSLTDPHLLLREDGSDYARLNFQNNSANYWTIAAYNDASDAQNDRMNFWNGTAGDVMTLTGDGEVGIGVGISPKVPFHVGNNRRVLFGADTLGNGDKLMFLPDLHAFRVGTLASGTASTYWNADSIGLYSFASGLNTRAQGFGATAMGRDTEATNSYAFASGFFTNADGQYSTAMGFNADALARGSTALGYSTDAEEDYSFAAGYFAEAQAIYSVAIGNAVRAQSYASMAVGRYNVGGGSATSWLSGDPIFEIGIGTGPSSRANAMTVRKNGNVGIGTTVPLDRLHVNGRIRLQTVEYFEDGGNSEIAVRGDLRPSADNIYDIGTSSRRYDDIFATSGTVKTSDARLKQQIQPASRGLDDIMKLRPVSFQWRKGPDRDRKLGLLAQEVLNVIPEVVKTHDYKMPETENEEDAIPELVELDTLGIYYSSLIPVLIKGMQEQQALIEQLEQRIVQLENR